ncbi:MAG: lasso peptide isopeptide bond-forming cyclase [Thermodesulfovibrionales bacterium]|jgi:asparagine synthase (glutamine-hydrolysing)
MSGIAGLCFFDGRPVRQELLKGLTGILSHRGPDGEGVWASGPVGLGHRMLHTTPESLHEKLPLVDEKSKCAITADARIDNRDELISALGLQARDRVIADSEIILEAYKKWGEDCTSRLLGDFAFAIWDGRKRELFCARDHFGVKPFYYYKSDRIFAFASEEKALFVIPEIPQKTNELKIACFLEPILLHEDKVMTFHEAILRLPPASSMIVSDKGITISSYWSLDPHYEIRYRTDEEYAEAFRGIFTDAVACRLRSAFPLGSRLSGGLDSSSVTCVASNILSGQPLHTFSAIFPTIMECDESSYINTALTRENLIPTYVHADELDPVAHIKEALRYQDGPFYAPNLFMDTAIHNKAKEKGVRIILDGLDGDTTVSHGIAYLPELARGLKWFALYKNLQNLSINFDKPATSIFKSRVLSPMLPESVKKTYRFLRGWKEPSFDTLVNPDFARGVALEGRIRQAHDQFRMPRTEKEHHGNVLRSSLLPHALEIFNRDISSFSMEARHPFFDKRLVEFCFGLPADQKLSQGWTRMILRRAMSDVLPQEIQWRVGKADLSPMLATTLKRDDAKTLIFDDPGSLEPYVNMNTAHEIFSKELLHNDDILTIWKVVVLSTWLRELS